MTKRLLPALSLVLCLVVSVTAAQAEPNRGGDSYLVLGKDLRQLKDDFNARAGSVRLMFIVGPTCGICLRGMADLNDEFISGMQGDPRLNTFVVHVPTLGAREKHVSQTIPLLRGPSVFHYWDEIGYSGRHYENRLDIGIYAWDVWMIYGPDALWTDELPPAPAFWQHQLSPLDNATLLNPKVFHGEADKLLAALDAEPGAFPAADKVEPGREAIEVAQVNNSMSYPARAYRRGHRALRDIASVDMTGQIDVDGKTGPLTIQLRRPNIVERTARGQGLPAAYVEKMAALFDFDGHLVGYRSKANDLDIRGMVKLGKNLAWRVDMELPDGDRWEMLIGSHGGSIIRWRLLDDDGKSEFEISPSDFRAVDGISFPFRTEYRDRDGALLAVETIAEIVIDAQQSTR